MREKDFQNKVEHFLKSKGIYFVKYWGGGTFTRAGVPDLLCCVNGRFWGIELKTDVGKTSELQELNLKQISYSGGVSIVLRPKEFEKFKKSITMALGGYWYES